MPNRQCRRVSGPLALCALSLVITGRGLAEEWLHTDLRYRLSVRVSSTCARPAGWPVECPVDVARWLSKAGAAPDLGTGFVARVVAIGERGRPAADVASQLDLDPAAAACGELIWLLPEAMAAGATRAFSIYFGVSAHAAPAPSAAARLAVTQSKTTPHSFWVDTGHMRAELVANADPGAPCRDLIHSWIRHDEQFDIAHKRYSILSNPCWLNGADGFRCYGAWPFKWRLCRKQVGPVRAMFEYARDHAIERDGKSTPLAKMTRRVSLYVGQPFVRDKQRWHALSEMKGLNFMEESYFESRQTLSDFGSFRDLGYMSRGPYTFVHLLDTRDERCYTRHFSSRPRPGGWEDGQCLTIAGIEIGDVAAGETIDYTVYQLYDKRGQGESPRACARRWQTLLTTQPSIRLLRVQPRGGEAVSLEPGASTPATARPPEAKSRPQRVQSVWRPPSGKPVLIPQPQKLQWRQGAFALGPNVAIHTSAEPTPREAWTAAALQSELAQLCGLEVQVRPGRLGTQLPGIRLRRDANAALRPGSYTLNADEKAVVVVGADDRGLFYGTQTLLQLVSLGREGKLVVPAVRVEDWPDMAMRGFHLCIQAGRADLDLTKRLIRYGVARSKMNTLVLEVEGAVKLDSHPETAPANALTKSELGDVVKYAKDHFLEVIPQVQSLGHCDYWLFRGGKHRDLAETPDKPYDYCPSNPEVYRILFDMYEELLPIFGSRYFHIGHDEVRDLGVCQRCKGKAAHELFAADVNKLHAFFTSKGVRVMMWPDMLLPWRNGGPPRNVHKALGLLPKDIIMCDWDYRGAKEFKGVGLFREAGFDATVTPWYNHVNNFHFAKAGLAAGAMGLIGSTWCGVREPLPKYFGGLLLSGEYAWSVGRPSLEELAYSPLPQLAKQLAHEPMARPSEGLLLDLAPFCNRSFSDPTDGSGVGWLGFGPKHDMSTLPKGEQWLDNTLFNVLDPRQAPRSCIVLRGAHRFTSDARFPKQVAGIVVDAEVIGITFLHACGWPVNLGQKIGLYRVHYDDAQSVDIPLVYGDNVMEWNCRRANTVLRARVAWRGRTAAGDPALLFSWRWHNPRPRVKVKAIDFAAADTPASPVLAAVTCHVP